MSTNWRRELNRVLAGGLLLVLLPLLFFLGGLIKFEDGGRVLFKQKRVGKGKSEFWLWKLRTMKEDAEKEQGKLRKMNEVDGPVFKMRDDPRYTKVGKWLSKTGLDELPQLWNVVRGEMRLVGPRPLPVAEAELVPKKYAKRWAVKPGLTSWWIVRGAHRMSFAKWMELDVKYVLERNSKQDVVIIVKTIYGVGMNVLKSMLGSKDGGSRMH